MARRSAIAATSGFAGGINLRDAISQLAPDEARVMENGTLDEKGAFVKRLGCVSMGTFGTGTDRMLSMYVFFRGSANTPQMLIHTSAGKLYYTNDPTANPIVWTQITTGLSTTAPMSFETFNSKCYMSNGVDDYAAWTGAAYTTFPSAPKGKFLRLWKDTMWISGVTGLDDRVYSSNAGDAETFGVASWVDIAKGDGDQVTALGTDGVFLIVFKRNRHSVIYDPGTFANRVVDFEKGCESHFSVIQFEGVIYFLSRRGICQYLGDSPSVFLSGKIDPVFDPSVVNLASLSKSRAYTTGNQVGWSIPEVDTTTPAMQIEYYPSLGRVTPYGNRGFGPFVFHRIPAGIFAKWRSAGQEYLFAAKNGANKVMQVFAPIGTDDGSMFTAILETQAYDFGDPTRTKYIRRARVLGRGNVTVQIKRNFQTSIYRTKVASMASATDLWSTGDAWGSGTWGPDAAIKEALINPDAYGRYFTLRLSDASSDTGRKLVDVGSREFGLTGGEWALFRIVMEATMLGVRD